MRHKLDSINIKIGYPKTWQDYSALEIRKDDLIGNIQRTRLFNYQRELDQVGEPIDPEARHMSPQTANAYYNVKLNEIVLPAAIWQTPFYYDDSHDPAVNYGAIGLLSHMKLVMVLTIEEAALMPKVRVKKPGTSATVKIQ